MISLDESELQRYGDIPRSDFFDYLEGFKKRKISLNDMLDEFNDLIIANNDIAIYETKGLKTTDLAFVTIEAFLGEKSPKKNQTQDLVYSLIGKTLGQADLKDEMVLQNLFLNVPDEIRAEIEKQFKESFISTTLKNSIIKGTDLKRIRLN